MERGLAMAAGRRRASVVKDFILVVGVGEGLAEVVSLMKLLRERGYVEVPSLPLYPAAQRLLNKAGLVSRRLCVSHGLIVS